MSDVFPSLRGVFGDWVYYPIIMTPEQMNRLVIQSKEIRESPQLDDYLQREITPNLAKLCKYIQNREDRFFNSIIIGVFNDIPDWYSLDLSGLDILGDRREFVEECIGVLKLGGDEKLFAIDGQHRAEAIKRTYLSNTSYGDQISVILVCHIDNVKGKRRTRRLFSDINKKSQNVSHGELVVIDEEEIENIVARKIFRLLEEDYPRSVAITKTASVHKGDEYFVNLITIAKISSVISKHLKMRRKCDPSEQEVRTLYDLVKEFFYLVISSIDGLEDAIQNGGVRLLRESGENVALRPIGMEILALAFVSSIERRKKTVFRRLLRKVGMAATDRAFDDVIFVRGRIEVKNKFVSRDLILYSMGIIEKREISVPEGFEREFLKGKLLKIDV